ncbi:hypothetical protein FOMG_15573 [Fusarium oxysporum f. sp. melonis 26406]|uniref:Rhodopsin domain-containing protein n=1 Tax=Fusarium oxysporum f. sp. melonis 26406 TaxID=1089452 RepID=W9Z9T6_FUSOX|nr:hypothetical protein FOMG_15573 [Fusarium oxysporum f. sp. melonis 26406]
MLWEYLGHSKRPRHVAMKNPEAKDILLSQILVIIATILVIARLNLRLRIQKRKLLLSDIFMVAAWISGLITAAFSPVFAVLDAFDPSVHTTLKGYHGGSANLVLILKLLFASSFPFYTTLYLCKAALLAVYLQVFPEFMVKRLRFLWATIWFVGISYIITIVILFCICLPINRSWDLRPSRTCPKWTYAVTFHVGWGLSFLGDLLGKLISILLGRCLIKWSVHSAVVNCTSSARQKNLETRYILHLPSRHRQHGC